MYYNFFFKILDFSRIKIWSDFQVHEYDCCDGAGEYYCDGNYDAGDHFDSDDYHDDDNHFDDDDYWDGNDYKHLVVYGNCISQAMWGRGGGALYHGWENMVMEEYLHPCPSSGRFNHIDIDVNIDVSIFWC